MAIQTILCAFDFSEPASRALRWAYELASAMHASFEIVHIHPEVYDGRGETELGLPWPTPGQEERYLRFLGQEVLHAARAITGTPDLALPVHILRGDRVKQLLACAEARHADLIAVGSGGMGRLQSFILGSVSTYTLRDSKVPVAIIH